MQFSNVSPYDDNGFESVLDDLDDMYVFALTKSDLFCSSYDDDYLELKEGQQYTTTSNSFFASYCQLDVFYTWYGWDNVFFQIDYDESVYRALTSLVLGAPLLLNYL